MNKVKIAWSGKHFGEEPPLVGRAGQGAGGIFFSGCNLRCVFCQNWQISQAASGEDYGAEELAGLMLELERKRAANIDLVTPTLWWRPIKRAIELAKAQGLKIPVVWNSNAYESPKILKELEGLVDIYLPDFKYGDDQAGEKYSGAKNYSSVASAAVREMVRQVGALKLGDEGLAERGVIVRQLILPDNLPNSFKALKLIKEIDAALPVSLLRQYYPTHRAKDFPEINRPVSRLEFDKVFAYLCELGLTNGWIQEENCGKIMLPDFSQPEPFKNS